MGRTKTEKLFDYVSQGKVLKVKSFLTKHHKYDLNTATPCRTQRERTLLHVVCAAGDDAVLRVLLKHGARADVQDSRGDTPLHLALQRVLHGHRHAFKDLVVPILKSCSANVLDIANNRGRTSRQLLNDAEEMNQERVENLTRDSTMETEEEKTRRKEEEEWQARFQDEWTDEVGGMWGENTTWNDQGYTGHEQESYDDWASRIAEEHRWKRQHSYEQTHPSHSRRAKQDQQKEQRKEEQRKFQAKLQEEHERYQRRHSERLHEKLLKQKNEYLQRCEVVFSRQDKDSSTLGYDDIPWPCRHSNPDKMIQVLMCDIDKSNGTDLRKFLRSQQLLWHPDKFTQKCGSRLVEADKSKIIERVTVLSQALNQMGENDTAR